VNSSKSGIGSFEFSILGWILYGAGLLSLLYVALASVIVMEKIESHESEVR
jgi:hypothetical protein